jgi:hypothetical protein
MTKFFIPNTPDNEAELVYRTLAARAGCSPDGRRYFAISYSHNGKLLSAEVGKPDALNRDEIVLAIFDTRAPKSASPIAGHTALFYICTEKSGQRGMAGPYSANPITVVEFEK